MRAGKAMALLPGAAFGGFIAGALSTLGSDPSAAVAAPVPPRAAATAGQMVTHCDAVDGDTLRCGAERIRFIGIDSPEMPGHCRPGRACAAGDPFAAKAALAGAISTCMAIRRFGEDSYGRTLAMVAGPLGDLSCGQVRAGHALYRADWDEEGAVRALCGEVAL